MNIALPPVTADYHKRDVESLTGSALLSKCGRYRYRLTRELGQEGPVCVFIMLNPSTADHESDDPTIRRCVGYAKAWGCGKLEVVSLFAFRTPDPKVLIKAAKDPRGPFDVEGHGNHHIVIHAAWRAYQSKGPLVCAWGVNGRLLNADVGMFKQIARLRPKALKVTNGGDPYHPLYLSKLLTPLPYAGRAT